MDRPRLLDLFCCAGGAATGYHSAGFDVVGVDLSPQPRYPFEFHQGDALEFVREHGREFDAIHASPPCQRYSSITKRHGADVVESWPDLVWPTRVALRDAGRPYVIENVVGAPLLSPVLLCGQMFDLGVYRHRLFETSFVLLAPPHGRHRKAVWFPHDKRRAGFGEPFDPARHVLGVYGHAFPRDLARQAMGMPWASAHELAEAIPPAYTEHIGRQLIDVVRTEAA